MDVQTFIEIHQNQLVSSGIPQLYWESLFSKLKDEVYDAGQVFQMQQVLRVTEDDEGQEREEIHWRIICIADETIRLDDPTHVYLIDHAWTYKTPDARMALDQVPGLVERMIGLMDIDTEGKDLNSLKEEILDSMWKFNQTYSFGNFNMGSEDAMPRWYIMDEFGSRVQHSDDPSFRVVPFFYIGTGLAYSVMWPIRDLCQGEEATRDFAEGISDENERFARLVPWEGGDLTEISASQVEPEDDYFQTPTKEDSLPSPDFEHPGLFPDRNVKVYIEYEELGQFLSDPRFEITKDPKEADVFWYFRHFYEFRELSESNPHCLINQFPCESVVTVKDKLAVVSRRAAAKNQGQDADSLAANPKWLPITYNLRLELPKFVSHFQQREKRGLDNHWICKPWNLARGLDTCVSKNLNQIIRLPESGPKVACKYIEDPVLFYRDDIQAKVKFDIRYIVLLSSVRPLKLFAYQVFWLRFANKPYSLEDLDDYEKHFTVMNYVEGAGQKLKQLHYDEFIPQFEAQNPDFPWVDVENEIFAMFREMFEAATSVPAPRGIAHSPQSRAMYAVDLMLSWETKPSGEKTIQPMVCEVNYGPDCARACKYHPFFVNDIFSVLFLDDAEDKHVVPL